MADIYSCGLYRFTSWSKNTTKSDSHTLGFSRICDRIFLFVCEEGGADGRSPRSFFFPYILVDRFFLLSQKHRNRLHLFVQSNNTLLLVIVIQT